jgi:hypothetical protein
MTRGRALIYVLFALFSCREAYSQIDVPELALVGSIDGGTKLLIAPDDSSTVVGTLTSVDEISPLAATVLPEGIRWYLVKTKTGTIGRLRQNDRAAAKKLENFF